MSSFSRVWCKRRDDVLEEYFKASKYVLLAIFTPYVFFFVKVGDTETNPWEEGTAPMKEDVLFPLSSLIAPLLSVGHKSDKTQAHNTILHSQYCTKLN